jgi:phosphoribosylaminoimidazole carboxylase
MEQLRSRPLRVACLGGGQLGRMMALEAPRLSVEMFFIDPAGPNCPAAAVVPSSHVATGSLYDVDRIVEWVASTQADVVTTEIEHVHCDALRQLEASGTVAAVQPSSQVLALIQDKYLQKVHFNAAGIAVAPFVPCDTVADIQAAAAKLGLPLMLKARTGAYDGRGNGVLRQADDTAIRFALIQLGVISSTGDQKVKEGLNLYAEGWVDFECEVAVMVARSAAKANANAASTSTRCYPAVNAIQQDSICRLVLAPARHISLATRSAVEQLAVAAIDSLPSDGASGVFGVELFVTRSVTTNETMVWLNEVAPRPHNTGHYTQDACTTSQFEQHLRAVCGLPLGSTKMTVGAAAMVNILGRDQDDDTMTLTMASANAALGMERASVHWYGKQGCRKGRKMGHINLTADSHSELESNLQSLLDLEGISHDVLLVGSAARSKGRAPSSSTSSALPLVGVIMGSDSDLPTMQAAVQVLKQFQIPHEVDVVSAHRTPDKLLEYSRSAAGRGIRVIIAGAGGAAHLPGMVAALTPLPVIGVPVKTSTLSGVDSLYSIVQMPRGVPVATVAIGNAMNAGLLAVRILSTSRPELLDAMTRYQEKMKESVDATSEQLLDLGSDAYLAQMDQKHTSVNV